MKAFLLLAGLSVISLMSVSSVANAGSNAAQCLCKCKINWFPSVITVTPELVGLPSDAERIEVIAPL